MSDTERDSQLSAMFDGELPAAECELVARRLARDPRLKRQWASYSLIGAVIRGEPLQAAERAPARGDSRLARRVAEAIAAEDSAAPATPPTDVALPAAQPAAAAPPRWQRPAAGLGIAAAVAGLAVFGLQFRSVPSAADPVASAATPAVAAAVIADEEVVIPALAGVDAGEATVARSAEPESYVVPASGDPRAASAVPSPQLANFVVAHSEYSAPWARRNLLSSILASEPPAAPGVATAGEAAESAVPAVRLPAEPRVSGGVAGQ